MGAFKKIRDIFHDYMGLPREMPHRTRTERLVNFMETGVFTLFFLVFAAPSLLIADFLGQLFGITDERRNRLWAELVRQREEGKEREDYKKAKQEYNRFHRKQTCIVLVPVLLYFSTAMWFILPPRKTPPATSEPRPLIIKPSKAPQKESKHAIMAEILGDSVRITAPSGKELYLNGDCAEPLKDILLEAPTRGEKHSNSLPQPHLE